jgi:hypothetical protein
MFTVAKWLLISLKIFACVTLFAQTSLPTFFSFNGPYPVGWTNNLGGSPTYGIGSDDSPAARFDNTGENIIIHFNQNPGFLSYQIRAQGNSVLPGVLFSVQQSVNGQAWENILIFNEDNTPLTFQGFEHELNPESRFVRFIYTNKITGTNFAVDEVGITAQPDPSAPRIKVSINDTEVENGSTYTFNQGNFAEISFENLGLEETLLFSNISFTGVNASEFSVEPAYEQVNAQTIQFSDLFFEPAGGGLRTAILILESNCVVTPEFSIQLFGLSDSEIPEPENQPFNLSFSEVSPYDFQFEFSPSTADGFLVLVSGEPIDAAPQDVVQYQVGDYIGNGRVVQIGSTTSGLVGRGIVANSTYFVSVFAYNQLDTDINYKQDNPLTMQVSTLPAQIGNYYAHLNATCPEFVEELTETISVQTVVAYGQYVNAILLPFEARDTTGGMGVLDCIHSGYHFTFNFPFQFGVMSREHIFPSGWYPGSNPASRPEYSDLFNLSPAHQSGANNPRGDYPLGEVQNVTFSFGDGKLGTNAQGQMVYEPQDNKKGDLARAILYMCLAYNGINGLAWNLPSFQNQEILKQWHFQDLPDNYEIARNEFVYQLQGNRNPFIDSVQFVNRINFTNMSYIPVDGVPCTVNVTEVKKDLKVELYPNPCNEVLHFSYTNHTGSAFPYVIYDGQGRLLVSEVAFGSPQIINTTKFSSGLYFLQWVEPNGSPQTVKFIKR